jgi:hypothetical protein
MLVQRLALQVQQEPLPVILGLGDDLCEER